MLDFEVVIWIGAAPIVIGIYFICRALSAPKKKRIISILVIIFALAGYISFISYHILIPIYCRCCGGLLIREYDRVEDAVGKYLSQAYFLRPPPPGSPASPENVNLPTLNDLAESAGYIPPEKRGKSSPLNPCVQESDLSVLISGDVEEIKILVYAKNGNCGNCGKKAFGGSLLFGGAFLHSEEVCAYLYGEDLKGYDNCN